MANRPHFLSVAWLLIYAGGELRAVRGCLLRAASSDRVGSGGKRRAAATSLIVNKQTQLPCARFVDNRHLPVACLVSRAGWRWVF